MSKDNPWLVETTDETFAVDVFERSKLGLVVVDFWADWCAPCRMLGPILEGLASESEGKFTLVKAETEKNVEASGQFAVAGIPAVFAVLNGEIIDRFEGALPETALREWLDGLADHIAFGKLVAKLEVDQDAAVEELRSFAERIESHELLIQVGQILLQQGCQQDVDAILKKLEDRGFLEPEADQLKSALALANHANSDLMALRQEADANPGDLSIRLSLAKALVGETEYEEAFEICLVLVEQDRIGTGEEARILMVDVFKALPSDSVLVADYRRKLSMLLF